MSTEPSSVFDAMVTDPPAGIGFAGHGWDADRGGRGAWVAWLASVMREALRTLKPGAHALVWALPRTSHWTAMALEDAGYEVRDCIVHVFASGLIRFNGVARVMDRRQGIERKVLGAHPLAAAPRTSHTFGRMSNPRFLTAAQSTEARAWEGWGTALKPATEHWWLVRRPLSQRTVVDQVLATGTGALNIDATRVDDTASSTRIAASEASGRLPSNLLLSHAHDCTSTQCHPLCPVAVLAAQHTSPRAADSGPDLARNFPRFAAELAPFRYCAKIARREREIAAEGEEPLSNTHPTVKPVALMRWLCRLVTPPGGTVLDPFMGSGTTGEAALAEGFDVVGVDCEREYVTFARRRLARIAARRGR